MEEVDVQSRGIPIQWDEIVDIIVVGYGFAGAAAAITAHAEGANVLLLEKAPAEHKGGNSRVSGNIVFWPNDIEKAKKYFKALSGPYIDDISSTMIDVWASEMFANRAWLEKLGMVVEETDLVEFPEFPGAECVRMLVHGTLAKEPLNNVIGEARLWHVIEAAVEKRNIRTVYETGAVKLLKSRGEVIGLVAERHGQRIAMKARRGVILTCGGFENNPAMARNYLDALPYVFPIGTPYNTGDGIRMSLEIGADLWHMANVSGPILGFKAPEIPTSMWLNLPHANSYIFVGADGRRFTMEGEPCLVADRHGKVKRHGVWVQQLLPAPVHMIFDDDFRKAGCLGKTSDGWEHFTTHRYDWSEDNIREIERGWIKKADSIAGLATMISIDPKTLDETVDRYNGFAMDRHDPDWGRANDRLTPIQSPPFYAMELTPSFVNTQGGPRRDEQARVIAVDGRLIPRLYSAGELGSIYGFLYQGGGNVGECFAFGRIAGAAAAHLCPQ
jgi:succinate dehydrogenase/fumarate reductase flavoprotein subunit